MVISYFFKWLYFIIYRWNGKVFRGAHLYSQHADTEFNYESQHDHWHIFEDFFKVCMEIVQKRVIMVRVLIILMMTTSHIPNDRHVIHPD
ncbi:hypothetical protein A6M27_18335 [Acidithiobacillus thiooxidans]|uniref:Uncharacterized protein n=1 Tax=Acidithiobacillus thiooxidans TaxID=930 RepID=A0A1C2I1W8_ACITH|nr:hypothetical protein A6O24_17145 [Acidithiobacillus thiooxidans]OCX73720.1 hypothetical protein A6M23_07720 [Acidithiobacillus thiooxidans]OCX74378.1 hypothetical protein A6P07_05680 [Acidithiobacillus thiooxidans]OCX78332.1 hypothetical protein A6P08_19760 [Acidithiobacillus thiooxidans]OCX82894.1 hypothetical protein A6M27_18335 [Acidithiobacillus thiooxidans]